MDDGGGLYLAPALYDAVNAAGTARETDALVRAARRYARSAGPGSVWLEPACGTGRYLRCLWRRGRLVRGYDAQPAMLAYATARFDRLHRGRGAPSDNRRRQTDLSLVAATLTTPAADLANLGPADVAFCPVNSLRHLMRDEDVLAHFAQVADLLAPGGVYLVGLDLHHADRQPDEDVWLARRGRLQLTQVVQYLPPVGRARCEQVVVALMADRPTGVEHHSFAYTLRTYTDRQWTSLLDRSPLCRVAVCDANGRPVAPEDARTARLPYQLEVLAPR